MSLSKAEFPDFGPPHTPTVQEFELPRFKQAPPDTGLMKFNLTAEDHAAKDQAPAEIDPREEAARLLAEAADQAAVIRQEAQEQGYAMGFEEGRTAGEASLAEIVTEFRALLEGLAQQKEVLLEERQDDLLRLVTLAVERVLEAEVQTRPELINQALKAAYRYLDQHEGVRVRLAPSVAEWLSKHHDPLDEDLEWLNDARIVPDPQIAPGGVILETDRGDVDATLEVRWQAVARVFQEALEHGVGQPEDLDAAL